MQQTSIINPQPNIINVMFLMTTLSSTAVRLQHCNPRRGRGGRKPSMCPIRSLDTGDKSTPLVSPRVSSSSHLVKTTDRPSAEETSVTVVSGCWTVLLKLHGPRQILNVYNSHFSKGGEGVLQCSELILPHFPSFRKRFEPRKILNFNHLPQFSVTRNDYLKSLFNDLCQSSTYAVPVRRIVSITNSLRTKEQHKH